MFSASARLSRSDDQEPRYRYEPKSKELESAVDEVSKLYQQRRVTIINLIYSKPVDHVRSFADAFKFKKEE